MSEWRIERLSAHALTVPRAKKLYELMREIGVKRELHGGYLGMRKRLREALTIREKDEKALFLVAVVGPKKFKRKFVGAGAFYCIPIGSEWIFLIKDVVVDKEYRKKGVARAIVEQLLKHAKDVAQKVGNGPLCVYAETKPHQKGANKFFESVGFQVDSLAVGASSGRIPPPTTRYIIEISRDDAVEKAK